VNSKGYNEGNYMLFRGMERGKVVLSSNALWLKENIFSAFVKITCLQKKVFENRILCSSLDASHITKYESCIVSLWL